MIVRHRDREEDRHQRRRADAIDNKVYRLVTKPPGINSSIVNYKNYRSPPQIAAHAVCHISGSY